MLARATHLTATDFQLDRSVASLSNPGYSTIRTGKSTIAIRASLAVLLFGCAQFSVRLPAREILHRRADMSLQYVEPMDNSFPIGVFAKSGTGGNQKPGASGQGGGRPALKKASKKAAKKKKK